MDQGMAAARADQRAVDRAPCARGGGTAATTAVGGRGRDLRGGDGGAGAAAGKAWRRNRAQASTCSSHLTRSGAAFLLGVLVPQSLPRYLTKRSGLSRKSRHDRTSSTSLYATGRIPHSPTSINVASGVAAMSGECVATIACEPSDGIRASSAISPRHEVNESAASGSSNRY